MTEKTVLKAGFWSRMLAHNIDLMFLLPSFYLISLIPLDNMQLYLICLIMSMLYEIAFIASEWQATPGKKLAHLKVQNANGERLSLSQSAIRTFIKLLSILTFFIGYLMIALHPEKKGLHDLLVKSSVIVDK